MIPTWTEKGKGQYKNKNDKSSQPTEQEWAQYYKIIGDEQHGDFVYHTQDGGRAVRLENKIVFDDGDFENPTVKDTYQFANNEEMNYAFSYWERKGVLR